jgi:hypothetical protein
VEIQASIKRDAFDKYVAYTPLNNTAPHWMVVMFDSKSLAAALQLISAAPGETILLLVATFAAGFGFATLLFKREISTLKAQLALAGDQKKDLDAKLSELKANIQVSSSTAANTDDVFRDIKLVSDELGTTLGFSGGRFELVTRPQTAGLSISEPEA